MTPDAAAAAAERTEVAVRLIEQAQHSDFVELVTVSALELCALGGPTHPLFEEPVAHAWDQMGNLRRKKLIGWVTEGMVERGLLIEGDAGFSPVSKGTAYSLKPALGIALAARCRPAFIITVTSDPSLRAPRFFALGDQDHPLRGVVVEEPAVLPADMAGDYPHVKKFGPLGRMYRHVLLSPAEGGGSARRGSHQPAATAASSRPGTGTDGVCLPPVRRPEPDRLSAHRPRRRHQGAPGQPRSRWRRERPSTTSTGSPRSC